MVARQMGGGSLREPDALTAVPQTRSVPFDQPWVWLAAGWRDLWRVPSVSLAYGGVFAAVAVLMAFGLTQFGWQSLILALAGGFLILGPILAVGLYEVSRRLEMGETISLAEAIAASRRAPGQLGFMGILLLIMFFAWVQIALLLFMLFMGTGHLPSPSEFVPTLLFSGRGLGLLIVGTSAGAVLAALVFVVTAVSVPLLMVRKVDVVTAVLTSIDACRKNLPAMALWAVLIAAFMALGLATVFVGLAVAFPLIGHASWHAFRDLVALEPNE
ncbi:MAG: DUF2189 domain-containing protein [Hyphomicrobiaceae bacterium]|nr:DUF2189 domain-containing protein [Hyphomicrobiaceae bacterium]